MKDKAFRRQAELALALWKDLQEVVKENHAVDAALKNVFRQHRELGSRDRRFLNGLLFAAFRWKGWLNDLEPGKQLAIAWALDVNDKHLACAHLHTETYPPSGDCSLEEKAALATTWVGASTPLTIPQLAPEWLSQQLAPEVGELEKFIGILQSRPPVVLRCRRKAPTEQLSPALPLKDAWYSSDTKLVTEMMQQYPASLQIQNLASQCVGHICRPSPASSWWDACSGAGGKSIHLADLMNGRGRVWSTDTRRQAINEMHRRTKICDIDIVRSRKLDLFKDEIPAKSFDGVLLDAPCSGLGTWARNADARWRIDPARIAQSGRRQLRMLDKVADAVKPGGRLIYSVCTLTKKETTDVIDAFLDARPDFNPAPVAHPLIPEKKAPRQWILPQLAMGDGMFVAHFKKTHAKTI